MGNGGSALDLLILLGALRGHGVVPEAQCHATVNDYFIWCRQGSEDLKPEDYGLPPFDNRMAAQMAVVVLSLSKLRHRPLQAQGEKKPTAVGENVGAAYGILADMDYCDLCTLANSTVGLA